MDLYTGLSSGFYQLEDSVASGGTNAGFPDGHGPKDGQSVEEYVASQWSWDPHSRYTAGDAFEHFCPAQGTPTSRVWGGGTQGYTSDSSVCTAAVHQGLVTAQSGGLVSVVMVEGQESYQTQPEANGITTTEWLKPWSDGYVFQ